MTERVRAAPENKEKRGSEVRKRAEEIDDADGRNRSESLPTSAYKCMGRALRAEYY